MPRPHHFLKGAALTLVLTLLVSAQTAQTTPAELSILIGDNKVKFTPLRQYQELRLEVFNSVGELIFASGAVTEAELNWNLHDSNGQRLAPGLYAYTLSLKVPDAETPRKHQGHFILEKGKDQIWLTAKGDGAVGAEVTGGELTVARNPERTTAGTGYSASGRSLSERAGLQRDNKDRTVADKNNGVTREGGQSTLNISGSGTTNRITKWLDGPNGVVGDSTIHETAGGDIGIGTTAPGGVFDLQRNSPNDILQRFWNTGTGGSKLRYVAANTATAQVQFTGLTEWWSAMAATQNSLQFRVRGVGTPNTETQLNNSARLTILRNGNVGIGTTAPAAKLEVLGDLRTSTLRQEPTISSPNVINGYLGTFIAGAWTGNHATANVVGATIGGGGYNDPSFSGDERNRVTDNYGTVSGGAGNRAGDDDAMLGDAFFATVGGGLLNTASGNYAAVGGGFDNAASNPGATVGGGVGNRANGYYATVPGGQDNVADGAFSLAAGIKAKASHDGSFVWADAIGGSFGPEFASTGEHQFLIRANGGVGVNTNTPNNTLTVNGKASFGGVTAAAGTEPVEVQGAGAGLSLYDRTGGAAERWVIYSNRSGGASSQMLRFYTNGADKIAISVNGHVWPATDAGQNLGALTNRWNTVFASNGTINTSDARLKTEVSSLGYGLRQVMQLRPVSFQWKDRTDGRTHLGLIAQEVATVIPEAIVQEHNSALPLGLSYTSLVPVVIKAIQEQQAVLENRESENATLRRQVTALEARLAVLEQLLQQLTGQQRVTAQSGRGRQ